MVTSNDMRTLVLNYVQDVKRRRAKRLNLVADALDAWIDDIFRDRFPADWREQYRTVLSDLEAQGLRVRPHSADALEQWLHEWGGRWGLLPEQPVMEHYPRWWSTQRRGATLQVADAGGGKQTTRHLPGGGFIIHETPEVSGPAGKHESARKAGRPGLRSSKVTATSKRAPARRKGEPSTKPSAKPAKVQKRRIPKGEWIGGDADNGLRRLSKPIELPDGKLVREVPFHDGLPVFDQWQLKNGDVYIAITGDPRIDADEAIKAWKEANKGKSFPADYTFHHDGRFTEFRTRKGKKFLVGRMQAIPAKLNQAAHIGSASAARQFPLDRATAREGNRLGRSGKGPLIAVRKRLVNAIKTGAKRILPIVGGFLVIVDFSENARAHGIGGAVVRAVPVLGDLVTVHDIGKELANEIRERAEQSIKTNAEEINKVVWEAHEEAAKLTAAAYRDVAAQLPVTNPYFQPSDVEEPIKKFYGRVQQLIVLEELKSPAPYPAGTPREIKMKESERQVRLRLYRQDLKRELREKVETQSGGDNEKGRIL